mgnify:CR=1 FL=1
MQRRFIFNGGYSTRFHTVDVHTRQDIGNHSFGVAWLCELLTGGGASKNLIMAALAHDLAEHMVGDIPSPAKRALGISKMFDEFEGKHLEEAGIAKYGNSLTPEECDILKYADMLEGMTFCVRERKFGNQNVDIIFGRFYSYIEQLRVSRGASPYVALILNSTITDLLIEWKGITNVDFIGSQQAASSGIALQGQGTALGLGTTAFAPIPPSEHHEVFDPLEKEERRARLIKG